MSHIKNTSLNSDDKTKALDSKLSTTMNKLTKKYLMKCKN